MKQDQDCMENDTDKKYIWRELMGMEFIAEVINIRNNNLTYKVIKSLSKVSPDRIGREDGFNINSHNFEWRFLSEKEVLAWMI